MAWILLTIAGVLEVVWATAMKQSEGLTRLAPSLVMLAALVASFLLLATAMRVLPLGTAYMVWTGIGALGAFLVGVTILGEQVNAWQVMAALLILAGIILMKVATPG